MKKTFTIKETAELLADTILAPLYRPKYDWDDNAKVFFEILSGDNAFDEVIIKTKEGLAFNPKSALVCKFSSHFESLEELEDSLREALLPFIEELLKQELMCENTSKLPSAPLD